MHAVLPAKTFIGRQITAPGPGRLRNHCPAFDAMLGAAGYGMTPLLYSSAITRIATPINAAPRVYRVSIARAPIADNTAMAHSARTLKRADARMAASPNNPLYNAV